MYRLEQLAILVFATLRFILATCPRIHPAKGVIVDCVLPEYQTRLDCRNDLPPGTEVNFKCERYHHNPETHVRGGKIICSQQGTWEFFEQFQKFYCEPECGRVANSTLNTLSSFIEREHEFGEIIFPWHAALFRRFGSMTSFQFACGGSLLAFNKNQEGKGFFILTAANCVTKNLLTTQMDSLDSFRIVLGALSTHFQTNIDGQSQIFTVKNIVIEKEYNPYTLQSNIAMIELTEKVKITDNVQPICFPTRTIANAQVRPGVFAELPVIRNDQMAYQEILKTSVADQGECMRQCSMLTRELTITEFCSVSAKKLHPIHSGTGLAFSELAENGRSKVFYLQGVLTKVGGEQDGCRHYDTYTSVSIFLDWIHRVHDELAEGQGIREISVPFQGYKIKSQASLFETPTDAKPQNIDSLDSDTLKLGVDLHNFYRRLHNSPPFILNTKLSKEAQDWAEYLLQENKWEFSIGKDYSENIFQYFGKISDHDVVQKSIKNWYSSLIKYNWEFPDASTFSQLVWKGTRELGLGVASNGRKSVVVANYYPKGNLYNLVPGEDRGKYFKENVLPITKPPDTVSLI